MYNTFLEILPIPLYLIVVWFLFVFMLCTQKTRTVNLGAGEVTTRDKANGIVIVQQLTPMVDKDVY